MTTTQRNASDGLAPSRRQIMTGAAGLTFGIAMARFSPVLAASVGTESRGNVLSPWVSIDSEGTIFIMSPAAEMGQGSMTSLPRIIAEELDADWDKVKVIPAPPNDSLYANPSFGMMYTAGSNAVTSYYDSIRLFGAQVRRVLMDNAGRVWGVATAEMTTEPSIVVHPRTGRRMSYAQIATFAQVPASAPRIRPDELKKPGQFRLIGKDTLRVEMPGKVNGSAKYGIDVDVPNMIYGTILRAPVEGASPDVIDDSDAKAIAGVIATVRLPYGVGILAETAWAAFSAHQALAGKITWTRGGRAWGFDSERATEEYLAAACDLDAAASDWNKKGDVPSAFAQASTVIEANYVSDYAYHAQMEPLNAVAAVAPDRSAAEIWCGTQSQSMAQEAVAKVLGVARDKVKLHDMLLGGGFGRRGHRDEEFIIDAVLMSEAAGRPVKVMWTREDDVHNGRFRPLSAHYLRAGLDLSGRIAALHQRIAVDRVLPFADPVRYAAAKDRDGIVMRGVELASYDIPNLWSEHLYRDSGLRTSPLRGVGWTANIFAAESFLDEIAHHRGIDPVALRLELLVNQPRARAVVEKAAQMANWGTKRSGRGRGFAFINYSNTLIAGVAEISVDRASGRITAHDIWCALDCGQPVHPDNIIAQTEGSLIYGIGMALMERITVKDGMIEQSNFDDYQVPRISDVPDLHIELIATDNHPTGVGQMGTPLVAPAIASALFDLTGVRLRRSPMTPARVRDALA